MKEWSDYGWSDQKAKGPQSFLKVPHYVVMVFRTKTEQHHDYHSRDNSTYSVTVLKTEAYVLQNKEDLEEMVGELVKTDEQFVFYKVESLGQAKINIDIKA